MGINLFACMLVQKLCGVQSVHIWFAQQNANYHQNLY